MTTNFASLIDHTLLKPDATEDQIKQLCEEAKNTGLLRFVSILAG